MGNRRPLGSLLSKHPVSNRGPLRFLLSRNPVSIQLPTGFLLSKHPVAHQLPTEFRSILLTLFLTWSKSFRKPWKSATIKVKNLLKVCFLYYTKTQSCFRFHKELTNVFLDIRKLERCVKVHRVERPVSLFSCASCKIWSSVGKMLFFVDRHIYASFLCGFTIKWLLQTFPSHCLFCSDKELRKLLGKTNEKRPGKMMRTVQDSAD